jgi:hypothetical protein
MGDRSGIYLRVDNASTWVYRTSFVGPAGRILELDNVDARWKSKIRKEAGMIAVSEVVTVWPMSNTSVGLEANCPIINKVGEHKRYLVLVRDRLYGHAPNLRWMAIDGSGCPGRLGVGGCDARDFLMPQPVAEPAGQILDRHAVRPLRLNRPRRPVAGRDGRRLARLAWGAGVNGRHVVWLVVVFWACHRIPPDCLSLARSLHDWYAYCRGGLFLVSSIFAPMKHEVTDGQA